MTDLVIQGTARSWVLGTTAFTHDLQVQGIVREFVVASGTAFHTLNIQGTVREFVVLPSLGVSADTQHAVTVIT